MTKKVLAIHYSQTGQLTDVVESFLQPFLAHAEIEVENIRIQPESSYPFPWSADSFFDTMPEAVTGKTIPLKPFSFRHTHYDLIIFAYQPWYLSPCIPANSILEHPAFQKLLNGANVVTLIGSRNMWLNAQEVVKQKLKTAGAKLVGNIALADRHQNQVSAITIMYWMFTGKKDRYLGIFPKPGISPEDVSFAAVFGATVLDALMKNNFSLLQTKLVEQGAVAVHPDYVIVETRAPRLFTIWANLILKRKNRSLWLKIFKYYLLFALFIIAPLVLVINAILFRPFLGRNIRENQKYYQSVTIENS